MWSIHGVLSLLCVTFFLLSPAHALVRYTVHDLGVGAGARAVNNAGQIAGWIQDPYVAHAARLQVGTAPRRLDSLGAEAGSQAWALNNVGTIVGGGGTTFRWTEAGGPQVLTPEFYARGINDTDTIIGFRGLLTTIRPVVHILGTLSDLGTLGGAGTDGYALAINASGDIVGESETPGGTTFHATLWPMTGGIVDLDPDETRLSVAFAVNDRQEVVGQANRQAFRWTRATGLVTLGTLPGFGSTSAVGINTAGTIVGWSIGFGPYPPPVHAWQWTASQGMEDLNSLVQAPGWVLEYAFDINDQDLIVGAGTLNGVEHAFALVPFDPTLPVPAVGFVAQVWGDWNHDGWFDLAGVDSWHRIWQCLSGEPTCTQLPGAAISLISGDFDNNTMDDLGALAGDWSLWTMLDGQHWQQIPGYLQTMQVVLGAPGMPDGMRGLGWDGLIWQADTLGAWHPVPMQ